jgi:hypothetical protein
MGRLKYIEEDDVSAILSMTEESLIAVLTRLRWGQV